MLALIPARGGSKGLPGKNIRLFAGKPLIVYSIEAAKLAPSVSQVICSTDSHEIAAIAKEYGAEVPFMRPPELAQDHSLAIDNYIYTVDRLMNEKHTEIKELVVLLPTAPLRNANHVEEAIALFKAKNADSVVSYYPAPHPVQWHKYIDDNGILRSFFPETTLANRQDEKQAYLPNGAIYIFKYELLKIKRAYYSDCSYPYIMPARASVDIDTADDFAYAEYLLHSQDS